MKFISWNVNGLRACAGKGFADAFAALDAPRFVPYSQELLTLSEMPDSKYGWGWEGGPRHLEMLY